jgi:ketosteroid isomerase-like protein
MVWKGVKLVEKFWEVISTNDFRTVGSLLPDDFVLEYPQSGEQTRGRDNYATLNEECPPPGRWTFTGNRIVGNDQEAVSDGSVSDGVQHARAISFFEFRDCKVVKIVEYWPDPFPAREDRGHLWM